MRKKKKTHTQQYWVYFYCYIFSLRVEWARRRKNAIVWFIRRQPEIKWMGTKLETIEAKRYNIFTIFTCRKLELVGIAKWWYIFIFFCSFAESQSNFMFFNSVAEINSTTTRKKTPREQSDRGIILPFVAMSQFTRGHTINYHCKLCRSECHFLPYSYGIHQKWAAID